MIYASAATSLGLILFLTSLHEEWKVVGTIGLAFYCVGLAVGSVIESRLEKRIKELEDKSKEA